jgi:hypothetical protein
MSKQLKKRWTSFTVSVQGMQRKCHDLLIASICHSYQNSNDWSMVRYGLDCLENVEGSFRIEAVKGWLETFAGVTIVAHERGHGFKVTTNKDWKGDRGADGIAECKRNPFYDWAPAEKPFVPFKMPTGFIGALAVAIITEETTEIEVIEEYGNVIAKKVMAKVSDSKIIQRAKARLDRMPKSATA